MYFKICFVFQQIILQGDIQICNNFSLTDPAKDNKLSTFLSFLPNAWVVTWLLDYESKIPNWISTQQAYNKRKQQKHIKHRISNYSKVTTELSIFSRKDGTIFLGNYKYREIT